MLLAVKLVKKKKRKINKKGEERKEKKGGKRKEKTQPSWYSHDLALVSVLVRNAFSCK